MIKHSIKDVIEHYGGRVGTNRRTGWVKIRCPFHDDSHASATINLDKNAFNCFACGAKGDTYSIIMQEEGVEFREAVAFAERITGESNLPLSTKRSSSGGLPRRTGAEPKRCSDSSIRVRRTTINWS